MSNYERIFERINKRTTLLATVRGQIKHLQQVERWIASHLAADQVKLSKIEELQPCGPPPLTKEEIELARFQAMLADPWRAGHPIPCRSCGQPMAFFTTRDGKKMPCDIHPVTRLAVGPHFATCPQGKAWSQKKVAK